MEELKVRSILVIDDDSDDYEIVCEAVKAIDPSITVKFLDRFEDCSKYQGHTFDIVLLDINMPYRDGFDWLKEIRRQGRTNLPVIMYTNSANPANIIKAYENGATLYYTKPESFSSLVKGLKELLGMDWGHPDTVTDHFRQKGRYTTFHVE